MTLTEMMAADPKISIAIFSVVLALIFTLAQKHFADQKYWRYSKKSLKENRKELRKIEDSDIRQKLYTKMLKSFGMMFKGSIKALFVMGILSISLFIWLRSIYFPVLGDGWIWYFLICSLLASIIFRKLFKVDWRGYWGEFREDSAM